jgi:hypothetical protein
MGGDVPRASEHNVECLATLVVTGLRVRIAIYALEVPFGFLEPHSVLLVLFRVYHLFALPLAGRCAISALLLQLLAILLHELHHFSALLSAVVHGVMHWTTRPSVITISVIPRSEIAETKPPHVCPGRFIHTYSNNMINRFYVQ